MSLRDRLTNPKDIERYDRNYNSLEVCITQGELDREYIHIPENATNGDMIKAVFPNIIVEYGYGLAIGVDFGVGGERDLSRDWWNAPYKRGDTDGKDTD